MPLKSPWSCVLRTRVRLPLGFAYAITTLTNVSPDQKKKAETYPIYIPSICIMVTIVDDEVEHEKVPT
jgi:hypothetical protein